MLVLCWSADTAKSSWHLLQKGVIQSINVLGWSWKPRALYVQDWDKVKWKDVTWSFLSSLFLISVNRVWNLSHKLNITNKLEKKQKKKTEALPHFPPKTSQDGSQQTLRPVNNAQ